MSLLIAAAAAADVATNTPHFPISATLVYIVGFIAAASIGSIAWYNSKRPVGWEAKDRPDIVPEVEKEETPGIGQPR